MYDAEVVSEYVIRGNTAVLKCNIPSFVADFVRVESWVATDGALFISSNDYGRMPYCERVYARKSFKCYRLTTKKSKEHSGLQFSTQQKKVIYKILQACPFPLLTYFTPFDTKWKIKGFCKSNLNEISSSILCEIHLFLSICLWHNSILVSYPPRLLQFLNDFPPLHECEGDWMIGFHKKVLFLNWFLFCVKLWLQPLSTETPWLKMQYTFLSSDLTFASLYWT